MKSKKAPESEIRARIIDIEAEYGNEDHERSISIFSFKKSSCFRRKTNSEGLGNNKSRSEAGSNREGDAGGTNRGVGEASSNVGQIRLFLGRLFQGAITQDTVIEDYLQILYLMFELQ
jgi:hypothetical protein